MDGDLISRRAMLEILNAKSDMAIATPAQMIYANVAKIVELQPAVDAEPVRHGRWRTYHITGYDGLHPTYTVPCSVCAYEARFTYRYCPDCGARMDGGEDNRDVDN